MEKAGMTTPSPRSTSALGSSRSRLHGSIARRSGSAGSPLDEEIWRRLGEEGFDEDMIRRRDKAALIAFISKLESELYDYQHQMGLLIIEKREWMSKNEQIKAAADLAEIAYKRDQATLSSTLSEARKREESLKKALDIERECIANIEKTLHELRAECAETKISAESKLAEAEKLMVIAQQKSDEADSKIRAFESMHAEASRCNRNADKKLQDVEAREDDLRRRLLLFKSEWDTKEKDLTLEKQSINAMQKLLQDEQAKLVERQTYLNDREEHIFKRSQELDNLEKDLESTRVNINSEHCSIKIRKLKLESDISALITREKAIAEKEVQLDTREFNLLKLQESISRKEQEEFQKLKSEHESFLIKRNTEFEADLAKQMKFAEDELDIKQQKLVLREVDVNIREKTVQEKENTIDIQQKALVEKEIDLAKKLKVLSEKETSVCLVQKTAEEEKQKMQQEREEMRKTRFELEEARKSNEKEKCEIILEREKMETAINERHEFLILEKKLKEEIDSFRAKMMELNAETERLRAEKERFEHEWELIDEKKDHVQKEAEQIAKEKDAACQYLKNEHDSLKLEKEILRNQFKTDFESLSREKEEMIIKMEQDHSDWFSKIQDERCTFVEELKLQKRELEICIEKRRQEVETYLREKEEAFEDMKAQELQKILSQSDRIAKELHHVEIEKHKLNNEKMGIIEDRALREREWLEIKSSINELDIQRKKLQEQRELLITDREEINAKIQQLKELQDSNIASENKALSESMVHRKSVHEVHDPKCTSRQQTMMNLDQDLIEKSSVKNLAPKNPAYTSPPSSATFSWIKKCSDVIFKRSHETIFDANSDKNIKNMVPIQPQCHNSNSSGSECLIKNRIGTNGEVVVNTFDLETSPVTLVTADKKNVDEKTSYKNRECTIETSSSSLQELEEERSRFVDNENVVSLLKKRPNEISFPIDSNSHSDSSAKCQKRSRQEKVAEGSPVESLSEIDAMPTNIYEDKEIYSTEHADISQIDKEVQETDNILYRESNGNGLPKLLSAEGKV